MRPAGTDHVGSRAEPADAGLLARPPLELWGGLECTVARVKDRFRDQSRETGHSDRPDDIAAIAALGIRTLRYPVLWETVAPEDPDRCDWSWHDPRLAELRERGIAPIAGLVHHGSGPVYTDLLDPLFPEKLAAYARRVAERYPWIELYTPVNEPLTTARFSGLYGHWYPHGRSYRTFLAALVNQIRGVQLSMQAIRAVNPAARLVQTEDLGKAFSTPELAYQAVHENERRWLGFDLLCGRVGEGHPFHRLLLDNGIGPEVLQALQAEPCVPDIVGVNHYLTSERYLDHQTRRYPAFAVGGNGRHRYADVEAVRVPIDDGDRGPAARLREIWERYGLPVAITEVHLGCTRDEQLRWLAQMWDAAVQVRSEGADIRAVTVWSLFGAVDWDSLLTRKQGHYEPGAFDVRGPAPRRTAIGEAAASLASQGSFAHPVLAGRGWWQRSNRFYWTPDGRAGSDTPSPAAPKLLIVGDGRLGQAVAEACEVRGLPAIVLGRPVFDPASEAQVRRTFEEVRPWAVVNCCGFSSAAAAEAEPDRCFRDNVVAAQRLAAVAADFDAAYVVLSTDQVFDGHHPRAYVESDRTNPVGLFGRTKEQSELDVREAHPAALVLRTGPLFGTGRPDMLGRTLRHLREAAGGVRPADLLLSPTFIPDLVHALLDLLVDRAEGVWHVPNDGSIDAGELMERAGLSWTEPLPAARPQDQRTLVLTSERSLLLPSLASALERHARTAVLAAAE